MKPVNSRRIVPIAVVTIILFFLMIVFQVFVIAGGYELEASTVKKVAPWAYIPFIKLVGEHPDTRPEWATEQETKTKEEKQDVITFAGFRPESIPVTIDVDPLPATNVVLESTVPVEEPQRAVTNDLPVSKSEEVVPVG